MKGRERELSTISVFLKDRSDLQQPRQASGTRPKTSTVLGPQASRITDQDRLQNILNLKEFQPREKAFADIFTDEKSEPQRRETHQVLDQRKFSSGDEDYFSTKPPYIDSRKEQSRRRKISHEVALKKGL